MIRHTVLSPRFVKGIPRNLEPGVLYVSTEYGTVVHSCCCGCGHEVVTPLSPTDWQLTNNGGAISLWPSVGNWNLPCRSHYVIRGNRVIEAEPLKKAKIENEQKRDKAAKARFYAPELSTPAKPSAVKQVAKPPNRNAPLGFWSKLWNCIR